MVLSPVLVAKGISNTVRTEFLIPNRMESKFISSVIAGAITNLIANIMLIPPLGGFGAAIGTLLAEIVACGWQIIATWKKVDLKKTLLNSTFFVIAGAIMFLSVRCIAHYLTFGLIVSVLIEICVGVLVYGLIILLFMRATHNTLLKSFMRRSSHTAY